jgi:hypothetical protein
MALKKITRRARRPSAPAQRPPARHQSAVPKPPDPTVGGSGSGSGIIAPRCKFFPKGDLIPVSLTLQVNVPLEGGHEFGRQQLNRPALLIHAQDATFACSWFSRAIDLGDESGNPAFWMLQKIARDEWLLSLRRVSGEMANYHLESKSQHFPIKLKRGRTTREYVWPPTITISHGE